MDSIAFVFSGQGAQYTGMGRDFYDNYENAKEIYNITDSIRQETSKQCFEGTKEELSLTINTQPCIFTVDYIAAKMLLDGGIKPKAIAGFSLGEIAALTFANVCSYEDGFKLVCKRAQLMHEDAQKTGGAMAAVLKLSNEKVEEICSQFKNIFPVNYNCPNQLVVAGEKTELSDFCVKVKNEGGKAIELAVSGAFHSPFMSDASNSLKEFLSSMELQNPSISVYSNYTAKPYDDNIIDLIAMQMKNPVLWQQTVENMINDGIDTFIEVGVGKTLAGLIKKINSNVKVYSVENKESLDETLKALGKGDDIC